MPGVGLGGCWVCERVCVCLYVCMLLGVGAWGEAGFTGVARLRPKLSPSPPITS